MQTLLDWLHSAFIWLAKIILCVPRYMFQYLMDGATHFIQWVYLQLSQSWFLPYIFSNLQGMINSLEPLHYYLTFFRLDYGFSVVICAWILRFKIRRVPIIG